jgi:hypothetical protein
MDSYFRTAKIEKDKKFKNCSKLCGNDVGDFWQWAYSDLLHNTTRGVLAEYIVAILLDVDKTPRNPWMPFDLKLADGTTIEVKSMSRLQAWTQKELSEPKVVISKTRSWSPDTGMMEQKPSLNADIYVICYFICEEHETADLLDIEQWRFFILSKKEVSDIIQETQSISINRLYKMNKRALKADEVVTEIRFLKSAE